MITLRQRVLSIMIVIATVFLFWQVYQLFFQQANAAGQNPAPQKVAVLASSQSLHSLAESNTPPPASQLLPANHAVADEHSAANLSIADANQSEYLQMVNDYQVAQLQRLVAEQKAAIALAQANAARAGAEASKYLPASSTNSSLDYNNQVAANSKDYVVRYVGFQDDQWSALLQKNGRSVEVHPGDKLPDGATVVAISNAGVNLKTDAGQVTQVSFVSGPSNNA